MSSNFPSRVADHYNQVEQKPRRERAKSDIIELRKFNNAMKSLMHHVGISLLKLYVLSDKQPARVLDLGCGKGGDLPKFVRNNDIGMVVGVDIADVSIEQCKNRFATMRKPFPPRQFEGKFFVADLTKEDISRKLLDNNIREKFHLASSQFSIHYSFESYPQAVRYISNAANNLVKLGLFIGTYPSGPKLLKLARLSEFPGVYEVDDILRVEFDPEDLKSPKPFGTKYHFKLKEVVDCPEFLVHPEVLKALMEQLGFALIFDRSFEEQLMKVSKDGDRHIFKEIFAAHDALDIDNEENKARLSEGMWSVASVYRCFCYRKIR